MSNGPCQMDCFRIPYIIVTLILIHTRHIYLETHTLDFAVINHVKNLITMQ